MRDQAETWQPRNGNYSTSRTSGDVDLESEKSDPLQLQPASSTANQVAKSVRHLLTDPRQFDILQFGLAAQGTE
jgi:hypothetical protein